MPKKDQEAIVRLHLWLERGDGTLFGIGRVQLLERVEAYGSIKAAADSLGMSYRAAWGKIKAAEENLGMALVEKVGGNKSGCRLTKQGQTLARTFRAWFKEVEQVAVERARDLFPFPCERYPQNDKGNQPVDNHSYVQQNIGESLKKN